MGSSPLTARMAWAWCLGAVVLFGGAAAAGGPLATWGLPEDISTYGHKIDRLYNWILGMTTVVFVITEGVLIVSVVRFRHKEGRKAKFQHGHKKLEMVWTIVPGVILFILAIVQISTWMEIKSELPKADLTVRVFAKQFEWNFGYQGPDGEFLTDDTEDDAFTINELHVPVDKNVVLEMRSQDVLHSLFMPNLRFKQDLVPGITIRNWFQATKTTEQARKDRGNPKFNYEIACAELCGISHHEMRARIIIHSEKSFKRWLADNVVDAPEIWEDWAKADTTVVDLEQEKRAHNHNHNHQPEE